MNDVEDGFSMFSYFSATLDAGYVTNILCLDHLILLLNDRKGGSTGPQEVQLFGSPPVGIRQVIFRKDGMTMLQEKLHYTLLKPWWMGTTRDEFLLVLGGMT